MRADQLLLRDILDAIETVGRYLPFDRTVSMPIRRCSRTSIATS